MTTIIDTLRHAFMITGFVFVMMLVIEYMNVFTSGKWQKHLAGHQWGQYVLAAFLGAIPGCLGAFAVVALYSHRVVTVGAVVAAMIATSGDESFVMFAMVPRQALILTGILFGLGILGGALTDMIGKSRKTRLSCCEGYVMHAPEECECFPKKKILQQWKQCSAARGILAVVLALFILALLAGEVGPKAWNWIRVSVLVSCVVALFIVSTVPDHFLEEHLWKHVAKQHIPRVFFWTIGSLLVLHLLVEHFDLSEAIQENKWGILLLACFVGLIPESGPHLVFLTLYSRGLVPFSVLLASSIVQDGHGMLPMLAHSKRAFLGIKAINLLIGILVGGIAMLFGV